MRSNPVTMVIGLAVLALALYVLPAALAGGNGGQRTLKPGWSAPFLWLNSCCPSESFECEPEPEYYPPQPVCPTCLCQSDAELAPAESGSADLASTAQLGNLQPERGCTDPEPKRPGECPVHRPTGGTELR